MAAHMVLAEFRDSYGYGWSERYWIDDAYWSTQLGAQILAFFTTRNGFLANDCELERIRVSSGAYKNPTIFELNANPGTPTGKLPGPATQDFTRLMIRWSAVGGYGRTFAGGVPAKYIVGDSFRPDAAILGPLNAFTNFISGGAWDVATTISHGKPPKQQINQLHPVQPRGYQFQAQTGAFSVGDIIRVSGATVVGYNGTKTVVSVTPGSTDTVYVGGGTPSNDDPIDHLVYASIENPEFSRISQGDWEGVTRRAAGRVFGLRRGRRASTVALRR